MPRSHMIRQAGLAVVLCGLTVLLGCPGETPAPAPGGGGTGETAPGATSEGGGTAGVKRFVFLTNGDDPFWDTCNAGFQEAVKELDLAAAGLKPDFQKGDGSAAGQINKLQQYLTESDIAGLAISVIQADNVAIATEMKNLEAAGVKVITVDGDVNRKTFRDSRSYYIGTDNFVGGQALGMAAQKLLEARMKTTGGYVQFAGFRDNDNARSRMDGFQEAVGDQYKEFDRMPDEMKRDKARDNVRAAIDNFESQGLAALIGIWAYNGPAIAGVVTERKVRENYTVCVFDAAENSIEEMSKGNVDAMVVQNPFDMGYQAIRLLKAMHTDDGATIAAMFPPKSADDPNVDVYTTGLRVVVPDEKSAVTAELFDPKVVEFMTLAQFKEWLAKYGLKSS